ncbi:MAG: amino acid ABC transporter permease [Hyphomicrobiales bacterium]|nr:amino acid ABC transporter permease [Hyphomicrobiales bacterium]
MGRRVAAPEDRTAMDVDISPLIENWQFILTGLGFTVSLSGLSIVLGVGIGLVCGVMRTYGGSLLDTAIGLYVDLLRSIPVLAILVWTYFAFPLVIGESLTPFSGGVLALGVHLGAYVTEVIRAGLTSIRPGQMRAALALGMSPLQAIRTIILPQALIRMLPPLGSLIVIAVKDSAIASVIAVPELLRQSQVLAGKTFRPFEIYTAAMLIYFLICYPTARTIDQIYRRFAPLGAS